MNTLVNKFPTKIKVGNKIYPINCDFRNCLQIILAFEDDELTLEEKYYVMLIRLYGEIPKDSNIAIEKGILFLDCGEEQREISDSEKRLYSFEKDSKYIYSALSQTHDIDVESIKFLHWWKFVFLFMDTGNDCMFNNIISLREKKNSGKLSPEERKTWMKLRNILDLDYIEDDEEESEFMKKWNSEVM